MSSPLAEKGAPVHFKMLCVLIHLHRAHRTQQPGSVSFMGERNRGGFRVGQTHRCVGPMAKTEVLAVFPETPRMIVPTECEMKSHALPFGD